jgi:hypothetical protein
MLRRFDRGADRNFMGALGVSIFVVFLQELVGFVK